MIKAVIGIIGVDIDDNYKWKDTLFLDEDVTSQDKEIYDKCKGYIKIKYNKKIEYKEARQIDENIYGNEKYIYDSKKQVKIYFEDENNCVIETSQEVNEWLVIMLQIMLLKYDYSFIHAAVVSKNEQALLLPSWGGVGKTACVSKLVKNGYKILGDDMNIIAKNNKVYGFPKKFVLYFYHKKLFPEVFKEKAPKANSAINNLYTKIIPTVKRILRFFPKILSFARKHNPQSIKVSPIKIFGNDCIEDKSIIKQIIWLERGKQENNEFANMSNEKLISKSVSVTLNEIFNENMNAILIMCGLGIIEYDEIFINMHKIYEKAFEGKIMNKLIVSTNKPVEEVADNVIKNIKY